MNALLISFNINFMRRHKHVYCEIPRKLRSNAVASSSFPDSVADAIVALLTSTGMKSSTGKFVSFGTTGIMDKF